MDSQIYSKVSFQSKINYRMANCVDPDEMAHHHENMLMYFDPLKPHFYNSKTGVYRGIHYFSYLCSKHRLWVLVRTASHNLCFEQKYEKYQGFFI